MKTQLKLAAALLLSTIHSQFSTARATTTINSTNKFSYGANIGWMDWRGDTNNGAVIGEYICSGYIYSANVGWVHLGSNAPANGIQYQNNSATDYGVNHDGAGNLRGYAYGANIGWINFESTGSPKVDMASGKLSGSVYSANCGWISLSNTFAFVQTDTIQNGADTDNDGIADAWERSYTNNLTAFTTTSDLDSDGFSDKNEYLADTNPRDPNDNLRITSVARGILPDSTTLQWIARPSRFYTIQYKTNLNNSFSWIDSVGTGFGVSNSTFNTGQTNASEFYRIRAYRPLSP